MKMKLLLLYIIVQIITMPAFSQDDGGYSITWHNGNVTLLKDLGKVDLHLKNGKTIQNVKLHRINEDKEIIEYEKNKTMHDLPFHQFKNAKAGSYSINIIYLNSNQKLAIKANPEFIAGEGLQDFPVSYKIEKNSPKNIICKTDSATSALVFGTSDTLIKGTEIIPVKIIELNADVIRYRRRDMEDGPLYIVTKKPETQIHQHNTYVKIYLNN